MNLQLAVDAWSAWSPDRTRLSDWEAWALGQNYSIVEGIPDIRKVPAMQRRRISSLSKMAIATAFDCSGDLAIQPCCIFASRHGELGRTVKIIESIVSDEDVSPTDFSLSVHNTALGLFSIFTENKGPSTMVVGGEDTFGSALIEACIYLSRYPGVPVLVVYFDEPLPEPLRKIEEPAGEAFSIALLLSANAKPNIEVSCEYNTGRVGEGKNPGLEFLKFYLSDAQCATVTTQRSQWRWGRL